MSVQDSVRVRSVALEHTECQRVKVGDLVVCFQVSFFSILGLKCHHFIGVRSFRSHISVGKITNRMSLEGLSDTSRNTSRVI